jgi:uncharacterized protein YegP (UPF0339 family)
MAAKKSDLVVIFERNNYLGKQQIVHNVKTDEFFWRRSAKNGNELSRSSETYETLAGCLKGMRADNANAKTWLGDITVKSVRQWK